MTPARHLIALCTALALMTGAAACGDDEPAGSGQIDQPNVTPPPVDEDRLGTPPAAGATSPPELTRGGRECGDLVGPEPETAPTAIVAAGVGCPVAFEVARPAERGRERYRVRGFACTSRNVEAIQEVRRRYECVRDRDGAQVTFNLRG